VYLEIGIYRLLRLIHDICGSQRGNTSIVGYALYNCGYFLGERIGSLNYEDADVLKLIPDPASMVQFSEETFSEFVGARNAKHERWGFKLPHASGYVLELSSLLRHPVFLMCFRNPVGILRSISEREQKRIPIERMLSIAARPACAALELVQATEAPVILIDTDRAAETPGVFLEELCKAMALSGDLVAIRNAISKRGYKRSLPREGVTLLPQ
jgi:hypothetical protein